MAGFIFFPVGVRPARFLTTFPALPPASPLAEPLALFFFGGKPPLFFAISPPGQRSSLWVQRRKRQ
jgi:hypothetical protein